MTHVDKSAGGLLSSDNDSQTEVAAVSRDQATATLASGIASDAAILTELIEDLINRGNSDSCTLSCVVPMLARMGALADTLAVAYGGSRWGGDVADWLITGAIYRQAHKTLQPKGQA